MRYPITEDDIEFRHDIFSLVIKCDYEKREQVKQQILANNKLREFIEHRIKCYEDGIEECEKHQLYGKMLHYPTILKELRSLLEEIKK